MLSNLRYIKQNYEVIELKSEYATFVVPTYVQNENGLKFLQETIQGMQSQTDSRWQAIFVEDCSPFGQVKSFFEKCVESDERINVIYLKKRESTGNCRNIGINWAHEKKSDIILFNDADDISHPMRVEVVKDIMESNSKIHVVYSGINIINENNEFVDDKLVSPLILEILESIRNNPPAGANCWYHIGVSSGYTNLTSTTSVRTCLAMQEKFPNEFASEDAHTWYRYAARGDFYYDPRIPTMYRVPTYAKTSTSRSYVDNFNLTKARVDKEGFFRALDIAIENGTVEKDMRSIIEAKFLLRLSESMGKTNDFALSYELALQANEKLVNINPSFK